MRIRKMNFIKNLITHTGIVIFSIMINVVHAQSDTTYSFTLSEAQEFAILNNTNVENADLDIESARKKVWETTAIGLPQISGSVSYTHIPGEIPEIDFGSQMGGLFEYIFGSLSELGYPPPQDISGGVGGEEGGSAIAVKNSTTYGVTLSQLVFSGEYIVGLQASRTFLQLSKNSYEKTVLDTKENVALGYFAILALQENINVLDSTLNNLGSILNEMKVMNKNGLIEETDVDQIQLTYNNIENSLSTVQRQMDVSYLLLKISLGLSTNDEIILEDDLQGIMGNTQIGNAPVEKFTVEDNIDFKSLKTKEEIDALSLKREKSKYLPNLSAFYKYEDKTNKADFDFTINHIIGINMSIPVFSSGMRNAKVQQAKIELAKTRNNLETLEKNLQMQVEQLQNQYFNALDKYETEKLNLDLSKKIYQKTLFKYKQGVTTSMDLSQANNQYLEAQSSLTKAMADLLSAKIALDKIYGKL